jgi:hypothetical protein
MHLDEGGIQALLHGELPAADVERWTRHASDCDVCAARLADARAEEDEVLAALGALDAPLPGLDLEEIKARASASSPPAPGRAGWRLAASIVALLAAAGALYALPGSPLRRAIEGRTERPDPAPEEATTPDVSGVAFEPGELFVVAFDAPLPGDSVRIEVVDDASGAVRVAGEAAFAIRSGRLTVTAAEPGFYRVDVPGDAPLVRVEVAGRTAAEIQEGVLRTADGTVRDGIVLIGLSPTR